MIAPSWQVSDPHKKRGLTLAQLVAGAAERNDRSVLRPEVSHPHSGPHSGPTGSAHCAVTELGSGCRPTATRPAAAPHRQPTELRSARAAKGARARGASAAQSGTERSAPLAARAERGACQWPRAGGAWAEGEQRREHSRVRGEAQQVRVAALFL